MWSILISTTRARSLRISFGADCNKSCGCKGTFRSAIVSQVSSCSKWDASNSGRKFPRILRIPFTQKFQRMALTVWTYIQRDSFTDNCICICMNVFAICRRPGPVKLTTGLKWGLCKRWCARQVYNCLATH